MRTIAKELEPASLTEYRAGGAVSYADFPDKDTLRICLVREQRGLCCYCLSRIRPHAGAMKVEHWRSQAGHKTEQLAYANLLASCMGGEGEPLANQHCDTRKADTDLSRNPADPLHRVEDFLRYGGDGRIRSDDPAFDAEINDKLNLNVAFLVGNRKGTLDAFLAAISKRGYYPGRSFNAGCTSGMDKTVPKN
jgi:uncharacterized protein (TIGR02646 family)